MTAHLARPERPSRWPKVAAWAGGGAVLVALALVFGGGPTLDFSARTWTFQEPELEALGLRFSAPEGGEWRLVDHEGASGNRALANFVGVDGAPPASAVVADGWARDLRAATRCRPSLERASQACGIVFRYFDRANHYVARVDAAKGAVGLGVVLGGVERELASARADVDPAAWQELAVVASADQLGVWLNGQPLLRVHDPALARAGRVGIWAPSVGEAYFDEFTFAPLPAARVHPSDLLPIMLRKKT
jgi:hypothetical protein